MTSNLELTRPQILAFRRHVAALNERLPHGRRALQRAAWAGLQDSMPRAALLSIHARMTGTKPGSWEDPALVQIWGPRFSTYVVAKRDLALFTLGRLPDESGPRKRAQDIAAQLQLALAGRRMLQGAERALLVPDERQRRALWTSRVWPGALLVEGETVGTWRRAGHVLTIQPWRRLSRAQRSAVEAEAALMPLPGIDRPIDVRWDHS
jgi:hypothetical protein